MADNEKSTSPCAGGLSACCVRYMRPCLAEFVGIWAYVFVSTSAMWQNQLVSVALAGGFTIVALCVAFNRISGAHFNPAITIGVAISGGINPLLAVLYIISQLLGSILGAASCWMYLGFGISKSIHTTNGAETVFEFINGGAHLLLGISPLWAVFAEMLFTFILVFIVLMTKDRDNPSLLGPIAIGFAVAIGVLIGGKATGGSMNPARSFGSAVVISYFTLSVWTDHWVFWVGPVFGSLLATVLYKLVFAHADKRWCCRQE